MPNIDSLISHASRLEQSFNSWNHAYIVLVVLTAVITSLMLVITGLVQWTASRKAGELDDARKAVIAAKDRQLQDEFAHRDERIAQVKAGADVEIARVQADSDQKIAAANRRSEEISAEANRRAGELKQQNLATEEKLEDERRTRLELEKSLAPRVLVIQGDEHGKTNIDVLKRFAGIQVTFEYMPDAEVIRTASQILSVVERSGWKVISITPNPDMYAAFFDGVSVTPYGARGDATREQMDEEDRCREVAESLVKVLNATGIQAKLFPAGKNELPFNTVRIRVGLKPNPYFSSFKDIERFRRRENKEPLK